MLFTKSDKLYVEAAGTAEGYERLLSRLKRARTFYFVAQLVVVVAVLLLCGWGIVDSLAYFRRPFSPPPRLLGFLLTIPEGLGLFLGALCLWTIVNLYSSFSHLDTQIKLLLTVRAYQPKNKPESSQ